MITPRQLFLLVLPLAVATATPLAQQEHTEAPPGAVEPALETVQADGDKNADKNGDKVQPARNESPIDYRPSEEISEDLPVSFPVDI